MSASIPGEPPADLMLLRELQSRGVLASAPMPIGEVRVLHDGEVHELVSQEYLTEEDRANPDTMANIRAVSDVMQHAAIVIDGFNGDAWGYWLHVSHPTEPPTVVKFDTEGEFMAFPGRGIVAAMIEDWADWGEAEDELATFREFLTGWGLELPEIRGSDEVSGVDPGELHDELYERYRAG